MSQKGKKSNQNKKGAQNLRDMQRKEASKPKGKTFSASKNGGTPASVKQKERLKTRYGRLEETTDEIELKKIGAKADVAKTRARSAGVAGVATAANQKGDTNVYYNLADGGIGDSGNTPNPDNGSSSDKKKLKPGEIVIDG